MTKLSKAALQDVLKTERYGRLIDVLPQTHSTMDDAREAAEHGVPDGHTVVAEMQHAGRGAHGRRWDSPPGTDLYFSIVSRPALTLAEMPPLTLAVGLAVREVLAELMPNADVSVKWPNDVWVGHKKCAGVLVETRTVGAALDAAIIGIGINVNRTDWPVELRAIATSVAEVTGRTVDRATILAQVLGAVEQWVDRFVADGPSAIVAPLNSHLALVGDRVRCDDVEGILLGVAPSGGIEIETSSGTVERLAGTLVRAR